MDKLEMSREEQMGGGWGADRCAGGGGGTSGRGGEQGAGEMSGRAKGNMPLAHTAPPGGARL